MAKLRISDEWWTAPAEGESGNLILVTGRRAMDNVIATGVYRYRVEVTWPYEGDSKGLPAYADSKVMAEVTDALNDCFNSDPIAVMTGIYTGDGQRNWVFYTRSLHIFQRKFNEVLAPFPTLPLTFEAEEDPDWQEYREMCQCEVANCDD
ncbi:MAG: DUF695 domain-containing protein [Muribaculaceae bacterium]|nr:DUF695 domain-containing protein [Muribaculaceae bacterium]